MKHRYSIPRYSIPLAVFIIRILSNLSASTAHAQQAQWIWGSPEATRQAMDGLCLFQHAFELDRVPAKAVLRITCDDQYVVRINNRLVGVNASWQDIERYDVTAMLTRGTNTVFVRARNMSQGPAGLLASLQLDFDDGRQRVIGTNASWKASLQKSGTWNPDIARIKQWQQAIALGDETQTNPWKGQLSESPRVKVVGANRRPSGKLELDDGDRVLFLGNTVMERAQRYGYWEAALTARYPDRHVIFRNLGWSGDTVRGEARARFGSQQDGFDHLEVHVHAVQPTIILCGYGSNAAFQGDEHLDQFIHDYEHLLDVLEATGAAIVLMAPLKHEPFHGRYLSPEYNANRNRYAAAISQLAQRRNHRYLEISQDSDQTLTDNGVHLTEAGYKRTADQFAQALGMKAAQQPTIQIDIPSRSVTTRHVTVTNLAMDQDTIRFDAKLDHIDANSVPQAIVTGLQPHENQALADGVPLEHFSRQANELVTAIRAKNQLYFHRWRPQNETYLFLFRKHEQGNNAREIPMFDPLVKEAEATIARRRQPQTIRIVLQRKPEKNR